MAAEDIRSDLIQHYTEMRRGLIEVIAGLSEAQMVEPSINGWSVKDHLAHLTVWDEIRVLEIGRISTGLDSAWPHMTEEQNEALNSITHAMRSGLPLTQVMAELTAARQHVLDAISRATPRGLDGSLYGEAGLRSGHDAQHAEWIKRWRQERGF